MGRPPGARLNRPGPRALLAHGSGVLNPSGDRGVPSFRLPTRGTVPRGTAASSRAGNPLTEVVMSLFGKIVHALAHIPQSQVQVSAPMPAADPPAQAPVPFNDNSDFEDCATISRLMQMADQGT